ncbi:GntR family transcriptional regulator [Leucobacter sp. USHLN153]|uniref:GntR family transcriptional regulator n=1 Tax=Leucobacter sp. USHLN153 TaxID=3081268 RepID=UPI003015A1EA
MRDTNSVTTAEVGAGGVASSGVAALDGVVSGAASAPGPATVPGAAAPGAAAAESNAPTAESVSERVAAQIREEIFSGVLPQGAALREVALAEVHQVSRRTVREALLSLASERLVVHERNRGASVRSLTAADISDLYAVRRTFEVQGARNAPFAKERDRRNLTEAYERLRAAAHGDDSRALVRSDLAFHGAVVALAGSPRLSAFYAQMSPEMEMAISVMRGGEHQEGWGAEQIIGDHRTIHEALIARDVLEAQRVILAHADFNERYLLALVA